MKFGIQNFTREIKFKKYINFLFKFIQNEHET